MPCLRQNAVSAGYDSAAPPAISSSWTRTRFPLQEARSSRIWPRYGSAFSTRWIGGTLVEFALRTLRTLWRESCNPCAISRRLTPLAWSSRIVVRCAWLSMFWFLFCLDSLAHSIQFAARAFDRVLRLLLLAGIHSGHGCGELF